MSTSGWYISVTVDDGDPRGGRIQTFAWAVGGARGSQDEFLLAEVGLPPHLTRPTLKTNIIGSVWSYLDGPPTRLQHDVFVFGCGGVEIGEVAGAATRRRESRVLPPAEQAASSTLRCRGRR